jgi:hypothetical protein
MPAEIFRAGPEIQAIVIRGNAKVEGISFFSEPDFSQQIGLMTRPSGYIVPTHVHNEVKRQITQTQEVLVIRKGACKVSLFNKLLEPTSSIELVAGDTILLASGAHRIEMQTECEILEIKQGPYAGSNDKTILEDI